MGLKIKTRNVGLEDIERTLQLQGSDDYLDRRGKTERIFQRHTSGTCKIWISETKHTSVGWIITKSIFQNSHHCCSRIITHHAIAGIGHWQNDSVVAGLRVERREGKS